MRMSFTHYCQRICCFVSFVSLLAESADAQDVNLSGRVTDRLSGTALEGVAVSCEQTAQLSVTDEFGRYQVYLPAMADSINLHFYMLGYIEESICTGFNQGTNELNYALQPDPNIINEVLIQGNTVLSDKLHSPQMSVSTLTAKEAKALPALFGEVDLIKMLQLKPGITPGPEGTTGLFVRGGNSDQNLMLLDNAVVYNANHLFGFFSTFSPDAVEDVTVYKGGFPAQYSGRLSSVLDVRMREGKQDKIGGSGGLGFISSRLTLEGPIVKNKHSFLISGRRTYADLITRTINRANRDKKNYSPIPDYYFYDLNAKLLFALSPKDRLTISGYHGQDVFHFQDINFDFDFDWGNTAATARWVHLFSENLSVNTGCSYSFYQYNIVNQLDGFYFDAGSTIRDYNLKSDFLFVPNRQHTLRWGASATNHRFSIARLRAGSNDGQVRFESGQNLSSTELGFYGSDEWSVTPKLTFGYGLHVSGWFNGPKTYWGLEPRLSGVYALADNWSIKGAYVRMYQYAHLLAGSGISLPTDLWYPSTSKVKPQRSDQVSAGVSYLLHNQYLFTWEAWYKNLENQVDFIDGAEIYSTPDIESQLTFGRGYAYSPLELEVEKKTGRLTGWLGYTLAWVQRGDFQEINRGEYFSPRFDTRHNASVVAMYSINKRWQITGTFAYTSGYTSWLPEGRFSLFDIPGAAPQSVIPVYGDRNTVRYPAYMRLDLGAVWKFKTRWADNDLTFSVYNATGRRNPYFIYIEPQYQTVQVGDQVYKTPTGIAAKQVSLFPALPSVTWNFTF